MQLPQGIFNEFVGAVAGALVGGLLGPVGIIPGAVAGFFLGRTVLSWPVIIGDLVVGYILGAAIGAVAGGVGGFFFGNSILYWADVIRDYAVGNIIGFAIGSAAGALLSAPVGAIGASILTALVGLPSGPLSVLLSALLLAFRSSESAAQLPERLPVLLLVPSLVLQLVPSSAHRCSVFRVLLQAPSAVLQSVFRLVRLSLDHSVPRPALFSPSCLAAARIPLIRPRNRQSPYRRPRKPNNYYF